MAKKKAKSKTALPKRIAGVKIPKKVRKAGLPALLASPVGIGLATELATLAAAAIGGRSGGAAGKLKDQGHALKKGGGKAAVSAETVTFALGEAARSFADALRYGPSADGPQAGGPDVDGPEPPAPKGRRSAYPQSGPAAH
jgi:hypothetical protein